MGFVLVIIQVNFLVTNSVPVRITEKGMSVTVLYILKRMEVKIKKLDSRAVIPAYPKPGDAGMDITAISMKYEKDYLEYGTGLSFEVPEGYVMLIFPRSSVSKKDMMLANCVGVLDSGYRGELKLRFNIMYQPGKLLRSYYNTGEKIGQIMIIPYPTVEFTEVEELSDSERGEGGFGSTGI